MVPKKSPLPGNLPIPLSTFVGRERELAEIQHRLAVHRLLTLTGPGGAGKTRLALQAANAHAVMFADGVWMAELASLTDLALVPQAVAATFHLREQIGRPLTTTLNDFLFPRQLMLVLDNCEHLIEVCAKLVDALLRTCPRLYILATSREPLGIPGEVVFVVPPLSMPEPQPWQSPPVEENALGAYQESEAVRLFVERAAAVSSDFKLTPQNGAWVAEICRRLDGMPLAIELAAARVRALSVQQIAQRLDDRFHLLTAGSRIAPPRHQTLEATLDWSYMLLSEVERNGFQRLSVFAGGWTLEAAETVCAGEDIESEDVLDILSLLVDRSLVVVNKPDGQARYHLLETIRQYAYDKLVESGQADQVRNKHLDYFVQWAEKANPHLIGPQQLNWLSWFEAEHDNLRAGLEWSQKIETGLGKGLRLAAESARFWRMHAYLSEGRAHLSAVLAQEAAKQPENAAARAMALYHMGALAYLQSDYPASRSFGEESLAIWRKLGVAGRLGAAHVLTMLGEVTTEEGDYGIAPLLYQEALTIYRDLENTQGIGDALMQLGWASMRTGDYGQVAGLLGEALVVFREIGNSRFIGMALSGLGELAVRQGQYERAIRLLEESLALRQEGGEKWGIGTSLGSLGWVALYQRDFKRMRMYLEESISVRMEIGDKSGIAWCLEKFAETATLQGQTASLSRAVYFRRAVQLFGAAAALRTPLNSVIDPVDQPEYERILGILRAALREEVFVAIWAEGSTLTLEQAVDYALSKPDLPESADKENFGGLSAREREVVAWISQGKSNRAIAEAMTVGVKTVETYITRILNKLGLDTRVQIAMWAKDKGLA